MCFKSGGQNKSQNKSCAQENSVTLPDYLPEEDEVCVSKTVSHKNELMIMVVDDRYWLLVIIMEINDGDCCW